MSTLLSNQLLPLWAWVLIIVLGSLVVISATAFLLRTIFLHKREVGFVETFGSDHIPQRKVTVRRGRVVPQSGTLSLTGSRFGVGAFFDDDTDAQSGARSKSPFEWWATIKDRNQNRNSNMTQISAAYSEMSEESRNPSAAAKLYHNKTWQNSSTSLSSKDEHALTTVEEVTIRSPSPAMKRPRPKPINFSRNNAYHPQRSTLHLRFQTLSRISEASPHNSIVSTRSRQSRTQSCASGSLEQMNRPAAALHKNDRQSRSSFRQEYAEHAPETPTSFTSLTREITPGSPVWTGSNTSLPQQLSTCVESEETPSPSSTPSVSIRDKSRLPTIKHSGLRQSIDMRYTVKEVGAHPVRKLSKKGTVLQKKSFKRSEADTAF